MQKLTKETRNLIEQISKYKQKYPKETSTIQKFVSFIEENPEKCYFRELLSGHLTSSCFILNKKLDHVLLTHHKKMDIWIQLGGHADGEKDLLSVAIKEAQEESGIENFNILNNQEIFDLGIRFVPQYKNIPEHYHYDVCYALQVKDTEDFVVSHESKDLKWVKVEKVKEFTKVEDVGVMASKWLNLMKNK